MTITDPPPAAAESWPPAWLAIPEPGEIPGPEPDPGPCGCDVRHEGGAIYLLHFDPPYKPAPDAPRRNWAAHYTGWASNPHAGLEHRLAQHVAGQGARLTQVQREAGGSWRLASVEPGDRNRERQLKKHSAARRCPICKDEAQAEAGDPEPELEAGA